MCISHCIIADLVFASKSGVHVVFAFTGRIPDNIFFKKITDKKKKKLKCFPEAGLLELAELIMKAMVCMGFRVQIDF